MIRASDRVGDLLDRDESLIEAFVAASPAFERLRNPMLRRTMARLATVEHAARVAGLDVDELVAHLNRAAVGAEGPPAIPAPAASPGATEPRPAALAAIPAERIVEIDVRDDLRNGKEPFSRIMAARREVPEDGALHLRAIFEPVPLYAVLARQGFEHWTERLGDDDWQVWFFKPLDGGAEAAAPSTDDGRRTTDDDRSAEPSENADVVVVDVRGLEPPEPMVRTLAALESLPSGATLVQINERVPQFLLPKLEQEGFTYEIREQGDALVRVFIRRRE